jgi:hypothetical protein
MGKIMVLRGQDTEIDKVISKQAHESYTAKESVGTEQLTEKNMAMNKQGTANQMRCPQQHNFSS